MDNTNYPGVRRTNGNQFEARMMDGAKRRSLGCFDTAEEAYAAYKDAKAEAKAAAAPPWHTRTLTAERLKQVISYDPRTGEFTRMHRAGVSGGTEGGGINRHTGYQHIRVDGRRYPAHRIAWMYMTGSFPKNHIDHIDGDRLNNRFSNLRPATQAENVQNRTAKSSNTVGLRGVTWNKGAGAFQARIMRDNKSHSLGYFKTPQEAHQAYLDAKRELHRFQPVPRDLC